MSATDAITKQDLEVQRHITSVRIAGEIGQLTWVIQAVDAAGKQALPAMRQELKDLRKRQRDLGG